MTGDGYDLALRKGIYNLLEDKVDWFKAISVFEEEIDGQKVSSFTI